jgi:hypothetical protein
MLGLSLIKRNFKANVKGIYEAIKWNFKHRKLESQIPYINQ